MTGTPPSAPLDEAGRIAADLPCVRCGYDLRGLGLGDACPECGAPVGRSASGDLIAHGDPDWADRVARGVRLILLSIAAWVAAIAAGWLAARRGPGSADYVVHFAAGAAAWMLGLTGAWLATAPDPARAESEPRWSSRRAARVIMTAALVTSPVADAVALIGFAPSAFVGTGTILAGIGYAVLFRYLGRLALRLPDADLAKQSRSVSVWLSLSLAALAVLAVVFIGLIMIPGESALKDLGFTLVPGPASVFAITGIVVLVASVFLLRRFGRAMREQAAAARRASNDTLARASRK